MHTLTYSGWYSHCYIMRLRRHRCRPSWQQHQYSYILKIHCDEFFFLFNKTKKNHFKDKRSQKIIYFRVCNIAAAPRRRESYFTLSKKMCSNKMNKKYQLSILFYLFGADDSSNDTIYLLVTEENWSRKISLPCKSSITRTYKGEAAPRGNCASGTQNIFPHVLYYIILYITVDKLFICDFARINDMPHDTRCFIDILRVFVMFGCNFP